MNRPRVSALIDTYNHERYIEQTLLSVLDQGLPPEELEIVVVDDGSTDNTASIVETFGSRVRLVRKKNGGQASAFNAGLAASNGEIIAILDGDDWWAKGKLQAVLRAFDENPGVDAVGHGYFEFNEETRTAQERKPTHIGLFKIDDVREVKEAWSAWGFLLMGSLTVRRTLLEWILPLPEEMVFMADSPLQVAALLRGALILEEPLFYYRQHSQNLFAIQQADKSKLKRKAEMAGLVFELMPKMFLDRGIRPELVWNLLLAPQEYWFQFDPPGKLPLLWFLVRLNYWRSSQQSWRFTALNYLLALGSLFFGYKKQDAMYEWRARMTNDITHWYRRATNSGTGS